VDSRTYLLFRVLGGQPRLTVLTELAIDGPLQHDALRQRTGFTAATVSKALTELEELGLVLRPAKNRETWRPTLPQETQAVIIAAAHLMAALGEMQAGAERELVDRARGTPSTKPMSRPRGPRSTTRSSRTDPPAGQRTPTD
jgi:DNA-binding HxlR family transcriptional regulator